MHCMTSKFVVDSRQTHKVTDATAHPTHMSAIVSVNSNTLRKVLSLHLKWVCCDWSQPQQTGSHSLQIKWGRLRWDEIRWDEMRWTLTIFFDSALYHDWNHLLVNAVLPLSNSTTTKHQTPFTLQPCLNNWHRNKPVGDLVRVPPLSKFRRLAFRNESLNQNSVETLYAGNVGHHCTKISENWIKNCRRSSISHDPSDPWFSNEVFRSQFCR